VPWNQDKFERALQTRRFGREAVFFQEIDSTNRWLLENEGRFHTAGATVIAEHQSAGRGRLGRHWEDVFGKSLLFSVLLRLNKLNSAPLGFIPLIAGIALAQTISETCENSPKGLQLKWPNDLLIDDKKVAGVLTESVTSKNKFCVVVGIGVNVYQDAAELPMATRLPASSLHLSGLTISSRENLLAQILFRFEKLYDLFIECRVQEIIQNWAAFSLSSRSRFAVKRGEEVIRGTYEGIGNEGQLLIRESNGNIQEIYSGEIVSETDRQRDSARG